MFFFFHYLSLSAHLEICQKESIAETQTFQITPNYFCPMGNISLQIRTKVPAEVSNVYSELRFEIREIPKMRYLIDYCNNGTKGCTTKNGILKYNRKFSVPTQVVTTSFTRESFNQPVVVRLIHHGIYNGKRIHLGCTNFTVKRQPRC